MLLTLTPVLTRLLRQPARPGKWFFATASLLLTLGVYLASVQHALAYPAPLAQPAYVLHFNQLTPQANLKTSGLTDIRQDKQGFLWIGGRYGLFRYDGYSFQNFQHEPGNSASLDDDWIRVLHTDNQGRLWVATDRGGLHLYNSEKAQFERFYSQLPIQENDTVKAMIDDGLGGLWLATRNGLKHFNPSTRRFTTWQHNPANSRSLASNRLTSLTLDEQGNLWVGHLYGLDYKAHGSEEFVHYQISQDSQHKTVRSLFIDQARRLWIGTNVGLEIWDLNQSPIQRRRLDENDGFVSGTVYRIFQDREGQIWLGLASQGLLVQRKPDQKFHYFQHKAGQSGSISGNDIEAIFQDRSGILWIATWSGGLNFVDLSSHQFLNIKNALDETSASLLENIAQIQPYGQDKLLLASNVHGLLEYDLALHQVRRLTPASAKPNELQEIDMLDGFSQAADHSVFVATRGGFRRFNPLTRQLELASPHAALNNLRVLVSHLYTDSKQHLWLASLDGLHHYQPQTQQFLSYRHSPADPDSISSNRVQAVVELAPQRYLVATIRDLLEFDSSKQQFTNLAKTYPTLDKKVADSIHVFFKDSQQRIWIGRNDAISLYDHASKSAKSYSVNGVVQCISEDNMHRLWLSTDKDLLEFTPETGKMRVVTQRQTMDNGFFSQNACYFDAQKNKMYFGRTTGLYEFDPGKVLVNQVAPSVVITDFSIFNQSVSSMKNARQELRMAGQLPDLREIRLTHKHSVFSLTFSALHFSDPQKNRYAYRLEGFDRDWIEVDAQKRFATYTNLPAGSYTFHVKAGNPDGVWSEEHATMKIWIDPPFWQTPLFLTCMSLLVFFSPWIVYRLRTEKLLRQKQALEMQVSARTVEVQQQKRALEESNLALQKANFHEQQRQSELTRFLAIASHDLRQPMHALNLYLGTLNEQELAAKPRQILSSAIDCARTMDNMFVNLLDMSRLDAQIVQPNLRHFCLQTVLDKIQVTFAPLAKDKALDFILQPCELGLYSDPDLVEQVLRNLVANAIRYTDRGQVELSSYAEPGKICIRVSDTGPGITEQDQALIFDEFVQLDQNKLGLGLGLAIVKRLSNLLHGDIRLQSKPRQGSTFVFCLPAPLATNTDVPCLIPENKASRDQLQGLLVVLIDDDAHILQATRQILEQYACVVVAGIDLASVNETLLNSDHVPQLIICDYRLQTQENGLQVIEHLREEFNTDIPALLLTGDLSDQFQQTFNLKHGILLHKPLQADALTQAMLKLLSAKTDELAEL